VKEKREDEIFICLERRKIFLLIIIFIARKTDDVKENKCKWL